MQDNESPDPGSPAADDHSTRLLHLVNPKALPSIPLDDLVFSTQRHLLLRVPAAYRPALKSALQSFILDHRSFAIAPNEFLQCVKATSQAVKAQPVIGDSQNVAIPQAITKKRHESMTDGKESEVPELAKGEEDSYAQTMRKHAKSAGNASVFLPKTAQRGTQRPVAHFDAAIGAFAQMRSVNVRIRAIKDSERAPLSLPDLRLTATNSPKSQSTDRHLIRAIHSSRKL